ncbi:MAG: S41 family peptidase [Anaerolineales bacterium]|nr:S41 family peptidase [Anaerolineales bacterium]
MSSKTRSGLTVFMLILLAISAFAAGYFVNDLLALREQSAHAQENMNIFWEAWGLVDDHFIGELPTENLRTYGAIRGSFDTLGDPYTVFVEPVARDVEKERLQGSFGGIGAYISRPEEGGDVLLEPIPGNPAEAAGILSGDVLLMVDGTAVTAEMTVNEIVDLIKGEKGTEVILTVRHSDAIDSVDIAIERADILIPSVLARVLEEDPSIGYIQLSRFSGESGTEVADALVDLLDQGVTKIILDMRSNPGGLLEAAVDVSDQFLDAGSVLFQQSSNGDEREFKTTNKTLAADVPLVVLVNGGTASAAEIVAGALQDRERAVLIGNEKTFGKGSVQLVFDLSDGSSVHVTSARWFTPDHNQIDGQGLEPDILVEITQEAVDNGIDELLQTAVEQLQ